MRELKKLELEYEGIRSSISKYTSDGSVINFLDGLKEQLKKNDAEAISYYKEEICKWYDLNITEIHNNEFVINPSEHDRNKKILEEIRDSLKNSENVSEDKFMYSKILLSHSSSDTKYGDALRKLIIALDIKNEQLIYSSHPINKNQIGDNIFDYLKENIQKDIFVIYLWSNEYLKSAACLNEMGATWIVESDYINIYTPDFDFNNTQYHNCAVDTKKMGIILKDDERCKIGMVELKNKLLERLGLTIDEQEWVYHLDEFMKDIK